MKDRVIKKRPMRQPPVGEMPMRWRCLQGIMSKSGMGGMLIYANQVKPEAIYYVANYTLLGEHAYCYLPLEGAPELFLSEEWDLDRAAKETGLDKISVMGENWAKEIAAAMKGCEGTVGIVGRPFMSKRDLDVVEDALGAKTVSASPVVEKAAIVKSPYELDLIREAGKWADAGFRCAREVSKVGMKDYELIAEIEYAMRSLGATDNYQMDVVGKDNTGMLLPTGKVIEPGDLLLFETTPSNGSFTYSAQLCRTIYAGEPSELLLEKFGLLVRAFYESVKAVRPGVPVSEVARIQNEIIGAAGYREYCCPPYMRSRGHSFGLGRIDIEDEATLRFEEGMSIVIHPNQFIPETGYLALGECIIVTKDGVEFLSDSEPKLYVCGEGSK